MARAAEGNSLKDNFMGGTGNPMSFPTNTETSLYLAADPNFKDFSQVFEMQALAHFRATGSLNGFEGNKALGKVNLPYIKDTWYMHTVMGGTQAINAKITNISANEIKVSYTLWDNFGAGAPGDSGSRLPGLPSLYWLQHNAAHFEPQYGTSFKPFIWNVKVDRSTVIK